MPDRRNCTGYHCATNGRTLAIVPFQLHSVTYELNHAAADPSIRLVPGKVIKGVRAVKGTRTLDTFPNGSSTGSDGTAHDGCPHSFPPVSDVLKNQRTTNDRVVVNLNAKLLYELALALGSDGAVSLHCDPKGRKATIVMPINGSVHDAIGVIMPLSTGKDSASSPYGELEHIAARFATVGR
jgi:hypothetical protein